MAEKKDKVTEEYTYTIDKDKVVEVKGDDGVLTLKVDDDQLEETRVKIFGKENIEKFKKHEEAYYKAVSDVTVPLVADKLKEEDEIMVNYKGGGYDHTLYVNNRDDDLRVVLKSTTTIESIKLDEYKQSLLDILKED